MTDREYLKLNTSIHTGSNAEQLIRDKDGNIEATIDLRLPDSLFLTSTGGRTIDKVEMLTTKMRLSLQETPIIQVPIEEQKALRSSCQLDVYPFSLLNTGELAPSSITETPFPWYKQHELTIEVKAYSILSGSVAVPTEITIERFYLRSNDTLYGFNETNRFYSFFKQVGLLDIINHKMNLFVNDRDNPEVVDNSAFLKNIGSMTQMLQDAIENAFTYASTESSCSFTVYLADENCVSSTHPIPNPEVSTDPVNMNFSIYLPEIESNAYFWFYTVDSSIATNHLVNAVKPLIHIDDDTMKVSYDTAAFGDNVPILWNSSFVETYDIPKQIRMDELMGEAMVKPPPKRQYKYSVSSDGTSGYNFYLTNTTCGVVNIIGNEAMKDTFTFLPWIKVDTKSLPYLNRTDTTPFRYNVQLKRVSSLTNSSAITSTITPNEKEYMYNQHRFFYGGLNTNSHQIKLSYKLPVTYFNGIPIIAEDVQDNWYDVRSRTGTVYTRTSQGVYSCPYINLTREVIETTESSETIYDSYNTTPLSSLEIGEHTLSSFVTGEVNPPVYTTETLDERFYVFLYHDDTNTQEVKNQLIADGVDAITFKMGMRINVPEERWHSYPSLNYQFWFPPLSEAASRTETISGDWASIEYVFNIPFYDEQFPTPYNDLLTEILGSFSMCIDPRELSEEYASSFTKVTYNTQGYMKSISLNENISLLPGFEESLQQFSPNLDLSNGVFYILDGETSDVNIGSQEVINTGMTSLYSVRDEKTIVSTPGTQTRSYIGTAIDNGEVLNTIKSYDFGGVALDMILRPNQTSLNPQDNVLKVWGVHGTFQFSVPIVSLDMMTPMRVKQYFITMYETEEPPTLLYTDYRNPEFVQSEISYGQSTTRRVTSRYSSNDVALTSGVLPTETAYSDLTYDTTQIVQVDPNTYQFPDVSECYLYAMYPNIYKDKLFIIPEDGGPYSDSVMNHYQRVPLVKHELASPRTQTTFFPDPRYCTYWTGEFTTIIDCYWVLGVTTRNSTRNVCIGVTTPTPIMKLPGNYLVESESIIPNPMAVKQDVYTMTKTETTIVREVTPNDPECTGNVRLTFTWRNLPVVITSPISSFVLTLQGYDMSQEIQPVNMTQRTGSSLVSVLPVVENYYSLATTLRDLHDELVVARDSFDDAPTYLLSNNSGKERTLKISAKFITKDGKLHQIYIPPNGVFSLQFTFGISYVFI